MASPFIRTVILSTSHLTCEYLSLYCACDDCIFLIDGILDNVRSLVTGTQLEALT
jgi:hypothetical protein